MREIGRERERARVRENERKIRERDLVIIPICKDNGDHVNCSDFAGIKLLSPAVALWKRNIDIKLYCDQLCGELVNNYKFQLTPPNSRFLAPSRFPAFHLKCPAFFCVFGVGKNALFALCSA